MKTLRLYVDEQNAGRLSLHFPERIPLNKSGIFSYDPEAHDFQSFVKLINAFQGELEDEVPTVLILNLWVCGPHRRSLQLLLGKKVFEKVTCPKRPHSDGGGKIIYMTDEQYSLLKKMLAVELDYT